MTESGTPTIEETPASARLQFVAFRSNLVRLALVLSWIGIGAMAAAGHATYSIDDSRVWVPVAVLSIFLMVLTFLP